MIHASIFFLCFVFLSQLLSIYSQNYGRESDLMALSLISSVKETELYPVIDGIALSTSVQVKSLWEDLDENTFLYFYVIRRPGCAKSREQAHDLVKFLKEKELVNYTRLIGIVGQASFAETAKAEESQSIVTFQSTYFGNNAIYCDKDKLFYKLLGNRRVIFQGLPSWNPFAWPFLLKKTTDRLKSKNIVGDKVGNGAILGGLVIYQPQLNFAWVYREMAGYELPLYDILAVTSKSDNSAFSLIESDTMSSEQTIVEVETITEKVMQEEVIPEVLEEEVPVETTVQVSNVVEVVFEEQVVEANEAVIEQAPAKEVFHNSQQSSHQEEHQVPQEERVSQEVDSQTNTGNEEYEASTASDEAIQAGEILPDSPQGQYFYEDHVETETTESSSEENTETTIQYE
jgi:hypothetical protein